VTAISIAYGLMVSSLVLPARFTEPAGRHGGTRVEEEVPDS